MKNLFIYAAVIAATMGSMTACSDFLDVKPVTNKQEPDFVSQEGITQLLTGMYARLNSTDANDGYFRSTLQLILSVERRTEIQQHTRHQPKD